MTYPDRFPYVRAPREGWRRAVIHAVKEDLPRLPPVSLKKVGLFTLGTILWLIYAGVVTGLIVAAFWLGVAGVRLIESQSEYLWPAFALLPLVVIAAGLLIRAHAWLRTLLLPSALPGDEDARRIEQQQAGHRPS